MSDLSQISDAISELAKAQAEANRLLQSLLENMRPAQRAKFFGVSSRTEYRRRARARLNPKPL